MIRNGETFLAGSPEGAETYRTRLDAGLLACVQDSANLNYLAAVAPDPLITLFGDGLGPAPGVGSEAAEGQLQAAVAGTQVSFDGLPAPILYAGPSQINLRLLSPYLSGREHFLVPVYGPPLAEDPLLVWVARPQ